MISQRQNDHVSDGLRLLTDAFKGKPVIEGLLKAVSLRRADDFTKAAWDCLWGWVLEWVDPNNPSNVYNASGQQLDDLGAIVGQPREGRSDADYIVAIKLRARINRSKGRSSDMVEIIALIDSLATYVEYFPLGWEVSKYAITNGGDIIRLLALAKAASSYGVLLTSNFPEVKVFKFSHEGASTTNVFATSYASTPDKKFPAALPTNPTYRRT